MEWKNSTDSEPKNGEFILVWSLLFGVRMGWYSDGVVQTVWSKGEQIKWDSVWKWLVIPELPIGGKK